MGEECQSRRRSLAKEAAPLAAEDACGDGSGSAAAPTSSSPFASLFFFHPHLHRVFYYAHVVAYDDLTTILSPPLRCGGDEVCSLREARAAATHVLGGLRSSRDVECDTTVSSKLMVG